MSAELAVPEPKEWGFLFKGPLALAVHRGTKTETRRLPGPRLFSVDGGPWPKGWTFDLAGARLENGPSPAGNVGPYLVARRTGADTVHRLYPRIQVGHRIWAKETWALADGRYSLVPVLYRADGDDQPVQDDRWRPSILMPRWAARSVREVVSVGLERLQDITEAAARAEGVRVVPFYPDEGFPLCDGYMLGDDDGKTVLSPTAVRAFAVGWDSINGDRPGANWISNPWVLPIGWRAPAETAGRAA